MNEALKKLNPDLYTRNYLVSKLLQNVFLGRENVMILDVGGKDGGLREFLPKNWILTVIDPLPNDINDLNYVQGDATEMGFTDGSFDFVVSLETLEHIPDEKKQKLILEMFRVSRNGIILTAPFYSTEIIQSEQSLNTLFQKTSGRPHPWLKEHFESGLPKEEDLERFFNGNKIIFKKFASNNLTSRNLFMGVYFVEEPYSFDRYLTQYYQFYNNHFQALGDDLEPTYRKIYLASKDKSILDKVDPANFKCHKDESLYQEFIFRSLNLFAKQMEIIKSIQNEKNEMTTHLEGLTAHSKNLENILSTIKSAKFYKLWETYTRGKIVAKLFMDPRKLAKGLLVLLTQGPRALIAKVFFHSLISTPNLNVSYQDWLNKNRLSPKEISRLVEEQRYLAYRPKISVVTPVFNTSEKYLRSALESVLNQTYNNWELCLADDGSTEECVKQVLEEFKGRDKRIKVIYLDKNLGISAASNEALKLTTGEFIALMDHDDELAPNALFEYAKLLNLNKKLDMIYSDEDKINADGEFEDPYFKPDWSPDTFLSCMYTPHLIVFRKAIVDKIGGFRSGFDGSQDYDLVLRFIEKTGRIAHIPKILYHWRKVPGSTAAVYTAKSYSHQASQKALREALKRKKIDANLKEGMWLGSFRVHYRIPQEKLVSIIIPSKDKVELLETCVRSILQKTTFRNYEILIIDNNSVEKKTRAFYEKIQKESSKVKVFNFRKPFNFSEINNFGATEAKGDYLLFLNNDTKVISHEWLSSLVEHIQRKEVGAVGPKLLFGDGTIQHVGVITGVCGEIAGHPFYGLPKNLNGYFGNINMVRNVRAVTGACLMTRRDVFKEVGGFDERFMVSYNDVDLCMRINQKGYRVIYTPYSVLYHFESKSLGKVSDGERKVDYNEVLLMKKLWGKKLYPDPYYNPNLSTLEPYSGFNL